MFDVGWPELLVIAIVMIVVVGPKDLPRMLRQFGRTTAKLRAMAGDFRKQFDEALKEAELDDVRDIAKEARKFDPRSEIRKHLSPMEKAGQEVRAGLDAALKPRPPTSVEAASEAQAAEPLKPGPTEIPSTPDLSARSTPAVDVPNKPIAAPGKPAAAKRAASAVKKSAVTTKATTKSAAGAKTKTSAKTSPTKKPAAKKPVARQKAPGKSK